MYGQARSHPSILIYMVERPSGDSPEECPTKKVDQDVTIRLPKGLDLQLSL